MYIVMSKFQVVHSPCSDEDFWILLFSPTASRMTAVPTHCFLPSGPGAFSPVVNMLIDLFVGLFKAAVSTT
jgi:hypothetical protein